MTRTLTYLLIIVILSSAILKSQQESEAKPSEAKPLELPNYIIEGKGQINVQTGIKQTPEIMNKLTRLELDSINSLKKEQTILLPVKPMPSSFLNITKRSGYLTGEFGSFLTPRLLGTYEFNSGDYILSASGLFESSRGDATNSDYFKVGASVKAENLAPEKFFIFGGSRTESELSLMNNNFNLYAGSAPVSRNVFIAGLGVSSFGNFSGSDFEAGASYKFLTLSTGGNSKGDHALAAKLDINGKLEKFGIGVSALLDVHSYDGDWMHFIELAAKGKMKSDNIDFGLNAGIQMANGTSDAALFDFLVAADINYFLNSNFTIKGKLSHSLVNNNIQNLYQLNPYISDSVQIDFSRINQLNAALIYHPSDMFSLSAGTNISLGTNTPIFVNSDTNTFKLIYKENFLVSFYSESYLRFNGRDYLTFNFNFGLNTNGNKTVTYYPVTAFDFGLTHFWIDNLSSSTGVTFIGERFADIENNVKLDGYFDLHFSSEYRINRNWGLFIKINNILNQNIFIWNGYRERGLFLSGGINYII